MMLLDRNLMKLSRSIDSSDYIWALKSTWIAHPLKYTWMLYVYKLICSVGNIRYILFCSKIVSMFMWWNCWRRRWSWDKQEREVLFGRSLPSHAGTCVQVAPPHARTYVVHVWVIASRRRSGEGRGGRRPAATAVSTARYRGHMPRRIRRCSTISGDPPNSNWRRIPYYNARLRGT